MREDEFFAETVLYRISVSFVVFLWMRCRVYSAWMVAESICVLNGIGIYPEESCPSAGKGPNRIDVLKYYYLFISSFNLSFFYDLIDLA